MVKQKKLLIKDYKICKYITSTPKGIVTEYVARSKITGNHIRSTNSKTRDLAKRKLSQILHKQV